MDECDNFFGRRCDSRTVFHLGPLMWRHFVGKFAEVLNGFGTAMVYGKTVNLGGK